MGCYYERLSRNKLKRWGHKNFKEEILASQKSERGRQILYINVYMGFPGDSVVKNLPASAGDVDLIHESQRSPGEGVVWEIPWSEEPGRLQSMGSLRVGHDWVTSFSLFTFHFHALEKEMATHSSVLAWRIPGTGKPGGLLSMGPHRVRHNWSELAAAATLSYYVLGLFWKILCRLLIFTLHKTLKFSDHSIGHL